jgi:hypothetical protein
MANEKERFEILLEEIQGDIKLALEGHRILIHKMDETKEVLQQQITEARQDINSLSKRTTNLHQELGDKITENTLKIIENTNETRELSRIIKEHVQLPSHLGV